MTKFAYCDISNRIRQYDMATPGLLPVPIYQSIMNNVARLAVTSDNGFVLCGGATSTGHNEIHKVTRLPNQQMSEDLIYVHTDPISAVRVRAGADNGEDRIYFSAGTDYKDGTPLRYDIYYLKSDAGSYVPVHYTTIFQADLPCLDPCNGLYDSYLYTGDFVFGDNDTLYVSNGRFVGAQLGIFKIEGAGPDSVNGGPPQRIHEGPGPIEALCYESPQTLYFLRRSPKSSDIWKVDINANTETLVGNIPVSDEWAFDLAEIGNDMTQSAGWWVIPSSLHKWLVAAAHAMVRVAEALQVEKPIPHPDPRRAASAQPLNKSAGE